MTLVLAFLAVYSWAAVPHAPIIHKGRDIRATVGFPITQYRLFKVSKGLATSVPFQIDEVDEYGDYILEQRQEDPLRHKGDGIFSLDDELSYMGEDVGDQSSPTRWNGEKPDLVYMIDHQDSFGKSGGYVYLGVYFRPPPPIVKRNYVIFDEAKNQIRTSRYLYTFNPKNYLVVQSIETGGNLLQRIVLGSSFFLRADFKYFLTIEATQDSIESYLDAVRTGPIRTIVRVNFFYRFLAMRLELGMYTEISLFNNAVTLPAVMHNPLKGERSLNPGSGFYYAFNLNHSPHSYSRETNIPPYQPPSATQRLIGYFSEEKPVDPQYWYSMLGHDHLVYVQIKPSEKMLKKRNIPYLFEMDAPGASRTNLRTKMLPESPNNLALFFDLTRFEEGEQVIAFQLYFDNNANAETLAGFRNLATWRYLVTRI